MNTAAAVVVDKDELGEAIKDLAQKYKESTHQELRFLVKNYLAPIFAQMREEYMEGFGEVWDEIDDGEEDAGGDADLANAGMSAVVSLGRVIDALTNAGENVPENLRAEFDNARALAATFAARAEQALAEAAEEEDEDEEDDDGEDDE